MNNWSNVNPEQLLKLLDNGEIEGEQIVDVREQAEWDYYHLPAALHIPMNAVPYALGRLPADKPLYVVCAHGVRSVAVCRYLEEQGYTDLHNVTGGMAEIALLQGFQYD